MKTFIYFAPVLFLAACNSSTLATSKNSSVSENLSAPESSSVSEQHHPQDALSKMQAPESNPQLTGSTSPGKPSAGLSMSYKILQTPEVGKAVGVSVFLGAADNNKSVKAKIGASSKMTTSSKNSLKFAAKSSADTASQVLTVTPMSEGLHYIYINAETGEGVSRRTQAFAIPIEVGKVDWQKELAPEGEIKSDGRGGKVISLPAQ